MKELANRTSYFYHYLQAVGTNRLRNLRQPQSKLTTPHAVVPMVVVEPWAIRRSAGGRRSISTGTGDVNTGQTLRIAFIWLCVGRR
ncbi:MAG: hypothetical protein H6643_12500 [Caldilineaceae bacterium]|nr:hypothetical protein [Caldilineaceae bacterium]